jgi:uncharacterized protein
MKLLLLIAVVAAVYLLFFKSKPLKKSSPKEEKPAKGKGTGDEMVACATCGTYVALDDAIISNGKYYCSPECLQKG